ncbi:hypothetical protein AKJ09_00054 [Labilithrix luteola]|uniref:Uncharacterized protein n=2 Tax=Labilithrix luteola TaxID=1391654 RepID=A0A0K1PIP2_9BACT|nr:hypothetical protein AKJ09_00054 [Labilithrix luteola]
MTAELSALQYALTHRDYSRQGDLRHEFASALVASQGHHFAHSFGTPRSSGRCVWEIGGFVEEFEIVEVAA